MILRPTHKKILDLQTKNSSLLERIEFLESTPSSAGHSSSVLSENDTLKTILKIREKEAANQIKSLEREINFLRHENINLQSRLDFIEESACVPGQIHLVKRSPLKTKNFFDILGMSQEIKHSETETKKIPKPTVNTTKKLAVELVQNQPIDTTSSAQNGMKLDKNDITVLS